MNDSIGYHLLLNKKLQLGPKLKGTVPLSYCSRILKIFLRFMIVINLLYAYLFDQGSLIFFSFKIAIIDFSSLSGIFVFCTLK